jgi:hypothetical protein
MRQEEIEQVRDKMEEEDPVHFKDEIAILNTELANRAIKILGMDIHIDPILAPDEIRVDFSAHDILRIVGIGAPATPLQEARDRGERLALELKWISEYANTYSDNEGVEVCGNRARAALAAEGKA